jgi:hypothetical protein
MPSIARCTLGSEEGALPASVVVIPDTNMYLAKAQSIIVDLYGVESEDEQRNSQPFLHTIELRGPQGEIVRIKSTFDDGAMVNAIDLSVYQKSKHRLKPLDKSNRILRMADSRLVPSAGIWNGEVTVGNITQEDTFEVFDSKGAWLALFGKPLLKKFKAIHDYDTDIVKIPKDGDWVVLQNQYPCGRSIGTILLTSQDSNTNQRTNLKGDHCAPPSRQVYQHDSSINEPVDETAIEQAEHGKQPSDNEEKEIAKGQETPKIQHPLTQEGNKRRTREERTKWWEANSLKRKKTRTDRGIAKRNRLGRPLQNPDPTPDHKDNIWIINTEVQNSDSSTEQKILPGNLNKTVFTRQSDPFKLERVDAVLSELTGVLDKQLYQPPASCRACH